MRWTLPLVLLALPGMAVAASPCPNVTLNVRAKDPGSAQDVAATRVVRDLLAPLQQGTETTADILIDVAVVVTHSKPPYPQATWCARVQPKRWDGTIAAAEQFCSIARTKKSVLTPGVPTQGQIAQDILTPIRNKLEAWGSGRWTLHLTGRRGDDSVVVRQVQHERIPQWTGTDATVTCLSETPTSVEFGGCRVPALAASSTINLDRMRTLHFGFRWGGKAVDKDLRLVQGRTEVIGLVVGDKEPRTVILPCGGEPRFELGGKAVEVSPSRDGPDEWSWSVRTSADDGVIELRMSSSAGGQITPSLAGITFGSPWYHRLWSFALGVVAGLTVVAKGIQEIIRAWKAWRSRAASP